jgi:plasmid replication initiation protein
MREATVDRELIEEIEAHIANGIRPATADLLRRSAAALRAQEWQPIQSMPASGDIIEAATSDGRVMIWRADILSNAMCAGTPNHLSFPATHWRHITLPETRDG